MEETTRQLMDFIGACESAGVTYSKMGGEEVTIFGTDYVPLPKDADGEPIHIGDELEFCNGGKVRRGKVQAISDCWVFFGEGPFYGVKSCRHTKPDTWERIITDALRADRSDAYAVSLAKCSELVERCRRLAGDAE